MIQDGNLFCDPCQQPIPLGVEPSIQVLVEFNKASYDRHFCENCIAGGVAFDAGIISSKFYTTLVLAAVMTSQFAGAWLEYLLRKGWPLLTSKVENQNGTEIEPDALCLP